MKITVMQVNSELASTGVSVYVDGQLLGSIGPAAASRRRWRPLLASFGWSAVSTAGSSFWGRTAPCKSPGA